MLLFIIGKSISKQAKQRKQSKESKAKKESKASKENGSRIN
jgi:hypothetical protein